MFLVLYQVYEFDELLMVPLGNIEKVLRGPLAMMNWLHL